MLSFIKEALTIGEGATGLLTGSTSAIKGVMDLVRKPNPDLSEIKALAAEAIDKLLEAKTAQMAMQDALLKLQDEQKKRDRFQAEAQRYVLTKTDMGGFVYALRPDQARGEQEHYLCTSCFEAEVKSMLQPVNFNTLGCTRCGEKVFKSDGRDNGARVARRGLSTRYDILNPYGDDD
ncbi:hypothetical protein [Tabrizicola fusiformis]|uniref:hypothetical protein n=1 Tax=Tabrizicola sp. SY72 TaxID=2741673 RepID=UPI001574C943|nr:hypothetical protein [Tabrizicola sp. SY72]NTT88586.1 hypothetical protein [Tabrizicola sp. SY72]